MERAVTLTAVNQITVEDLPQKIICHQSDQIVIGGESPDELAPLSAIEDQYIQHVLRVVGGNRTLAAKVLGLDRKTLYRKLKQVDVQPAS
jgi:two-component system response regulator HydG